MIMTIRNLVCGLVLACVAAAGVHAAGAKQKSFATPEAAAAALVAALKAGKVDATAEVLGPGGGAILASGDKTADARGRALFVQLYEEGNKIEKAGDDKAVVSIGKDAWPFPIPMVKDAAGWRFDVEAGREEILNRRIGRNELFTMQAALAYVDAQREYYLANPQKAKLYQYAQKFVSTPGKRDGLYYPTKAGEPQSPLGPRYEAAKQAGYTKESGSYHGYRYRILKAQGADAKGGAYDYTAKGALIGGHALIAWPASYGNSGVMTFMVSHDGTLYEKDLGPGTEAAAGRITRFNPDKTWKAVAK
jgi:hypothetical protein